VEWYCIKKLLKTNPSKMLHVRILCNFNRFSRVKKIIWLSAMQPLFRLQNEIIRQKFGGSHKEWLHPFEDRGSCLDIGCQWIDSCGNIVSYWMARVFLLFG
jgi:hypothetical protein